MNKRGQREQESKDFEYFYYYYYHYLCTINQVALCEAGLQWVYILRVDGLIQGHVVALQIPS